jgi:hypothetical protein
MTLEDYVKAHLEPGWRMEIFSPWSIATIAPDGSVMLYKNNLVKMDTINLSRNDIMHLRNIQLPVEIFEPGPESEKDVHTEHCCIRHGCKYGKEDCPVVTRAKKQSFACEYCQYDAEGYTQAGIHAQNLVIDKIIETCGGCPAQWSARSTDGKYIYIRYRHGHFRIDVDGNTVFEDDFISAYGGDGVLSYEELVTRTAGILDFTQAKWVETREEVEG